MSGRTNGHAKGSPVLPREVRLLVLAMGIGGVAVTAWRAAQASSWTFGDLMAWGLLAGGIALTEQFPVRLSFGTERIAFSLTEAVWVAAVMTARPSVVALAVAAGVLVGHGAKRKPLPKLVFNVGQFALSVTAAQLVYGVFQAPAAPSPRVWLGCAAAVSAYAVVNAGSVALVVSRMERMAFRSVFIPPLGANALHFAGNTAIGLAGATMWTASALALPVLCILLALAHIAYRTAIGNVQRAQLATFPAPGRAMERRWPAPIG